MVFAVPKGSGTSPAAASVVMKKYKKACYTLLTLNMMLGFTICLRHDVKEPVSIQLEISTYRIPVLVGQYLYKISSG